VQSTGLERGKWSKGDAEVEGGGVFLSSNMVVWFEAGTREGTYGSVT